MKKSKHIAAIVLPSLAMLALILDSKTALQGARQGLELCIQTVIPSLFPFFVVSITLTNIISGCDIRVLRPIYRFCKMPRGSENLLIIGLLGGYPVGAKCVYDAWKFGQITTIDAKRCLGFCCNAGPAFIFGMCGTLFSELWIVWVLWGIHIFSALLVGNILPKNGAYTMPITRNKHISLPEAMAKGINAILSVSGWVILFRVIISFGERWFLWLFPEKWHIIFECILELANGCRALISLQSEGMRFILCSVFLSLGGLCVGLQTMSVVRELGTGMYFPGKALQGAISGCIALLFASVQYRICSPIMPAVVTIGLLVFIIIKKTVAFQKRLVYNVEKNLKGDSLCYSGRKLQNLVAIAPVERK